MERAMKVKMKLLTAAVLLANQAPLLAQQDLVPQAGVVEEVIVQARFIPDEKRTTAAVANVLDASMFAVAGDANVAEGLKRIPGLNLQGGKFVYVRGLGERYSSTVLNGSTLPSPEPINRVVPLDLFPASIIESVLVQKTFSAQYPAEFAGGTIQMRTKIVPEETFLTLSSSVGYSGNTTGKRGLSYDGGGKDWLGTDDGTRDMPPPLKAAVSGDRELRPNNILYNKGFTASELQAIGQSLDNNYQVSDKNIGPDASGSLNFGLAFEPGDGDLRLGLLGNASYSNTWDTIEVSRNSYTPDGKGELSPNDQLDWHSTEQSIDNSLFLTAGLSWLDAHTLKATVLQIHKVDDLAGHLNGYSAGESVNIDQYRLEWIEQDLLSRQIDGEHLLHAASDLRFRWHYNESRAKREAPDMREYRYFYDTEKQDYFFSLRGDANTRMWSWLEDENKDLGFSLSAYLETPFNTATDLVVGMARMNKERDADIRRFGFTGTIDRDLLYAPLNEILGPQHIGPNGFELREATRPTDNYVAQQKLEAWFVEADIEINPMFRLLAGARGEESSQYVKTFDLFKDGVAIESRLESDDIFPVLTGTLVLDQWNMQLRAGYSETISRPDFRELSPSPFTHPVTGYNIIGNPALTVAYINNYDLRWEWYFSGDESLSIGAFYKEFDAPIEMVIRPGTTGDRSFINADSATSEGLEVEFSKGLGFVHEGLQDFFVSTNATFIKSEVSIRPQDAGTLTNATRPLQGQADHIFNVQLGYDDGFRQKGSFTYHLTGEKIREVGILGAPDVMDQPYGELDFSYTRYIGDHMEFNLKAKNLLNQAVETTQGGFDVNTYREGTSASVGLTYTF